MENAAHMLAAFCISMMVLAVSGIGIDQGGVIAIVSVLIGIPAGLVWIGSGMMLLLNKPSKT